MKVKTRIQIIAILPIVMAVIICFVLYHTSTGIENMVLSLRAANGISHEVFRLNTATIQYIRKPVPENTERWFSIHRQMGLSLIRESADNPEDKALIGDIQKLSEDMNALFTELTRSGPADTQGGQAAAQASPDRFQQLLDKSQSMMTIALTLAAKGHDQAIAIQNSALMLIIAASAILSAALVILAILLGRTIFRSIRVLHDGTARLAQGKLDHQIPVESRDELGELVEAFNTMTGALSKSQASLQAEIAERERIAESLRESNRALSDALTRLKRAQYESIQQERLKALQQIASGIVHDINDALMPIMGFSEFLLQHPDQIANSRENRECMQAIHDGVTKATSVTRHLSEYFYPTRNEDLQLVDVNRLVPDALSMTSATRSSAGGKLSVQTDLGLVPPFESCERDLRDALTNLILNAMEAMPDGGALTVRTRVDQAQVLLEVADTGTGMTTTTIRRCFEPFFSTKGSNHSGMGLTIAQGAVNRCHGTIEVQSEPGNGSTFTIRLPLVAPAQAKKSSPKKPFNRKLNILIADDEAWVRKILERQLQSDGHTTDIANDGREAIGKFRSGQFDLVILDRAMPFLSGDEVAAEIVKLSPGTPIIMVTGFGDMMANAGDSPAGVQCVISKPMTYEKLREAILKVTQ